MAENKSRGSIWNHLQRKRGTDSGQWDRATLYGQGRAGIFIYRQYSGDAAEIEIEAVSNDIIPLNQNLRVGVKTEAGKTKIKLSGYQDDFYTAVLKI